MSIPMIEEVVDALEDVGFSVTVQYPYVIVSLASRSISTMEVATALDIDQSLCVRCVGGDIRILCD